MADYAVGDIQGCLDPLKKLLDSVGFEPKTDRLYATGDLVNRGSQSLETLRFLYSLGEAFETVLGNHDLHLLALAADAKKPSAKDTLSCILKAPDRDELLAWLRMRPLLLVADDYLLVHAGVPPQWNREDALTRAKEVEQVLRGEHHLELLKCMYGNAPTRWQPTLGREEQLRTITNYFTRMRFCNEHGDLELSTKTGPGRPPPGYSPWYAIPGRKMAHQKIVFGHWAALAGARCGENLFPLDTGCVWGAQMRLMRLGDEHYFHCPCS